MAFNIFERWPWSSFQNLNLDWLMKAVKEAGTKADEAASSVGQFDARITQNASAIEQLGIDLETISSTARVFVNSNLEAFYRGNHITGAELVAMVRQHGDLPYVEYNGEIYMPDTVSTAGDMRFSMGHTVQGFGSLVVRHIMIPAASYNAAYSITNVSGGSGSSDVFTVTITEQNENFVADHTYAEITSQMEAGRTPVFVIKYGTSYVVSSVYDVTAGTRIDIYDSPTINDPNGSVNITRYTIYSDNTIGRNNAVTQLASLDNLFDNAVCYTPQTLTAAQQAQARENIGAVGAPYQIPITVSGGVYSTTATGSEIYDNRASCYAEVNGVMFYPVGCNSSGPFGNLYLASAEPTASNTISNDVLKITMNGTAVATVQHFTTDVDALPVVTASDNGKFMRVVSGVWVAEAVPSAESNSFGGA